MKKKIYSILNELCVPCHLKGRKFLEAAIEMVIVNNNISITRELYPRIAEKFATTALCVEKNIRAAISTSLAFCLDESFIKYFGNRKVNHNMRNCEYIFAIAKHIEVYWDESI